MSIWRLLMPYTPQTSPQPLLDTLVWWNIRAEGSEAGSYHSSAMLSRSQHYGQRLRDPQSLLCALATRTQSCAVLDVNSLSPSPPVIIDPSLPASTGPNQSKPASGEELYGCSTRDAVRPGRTLRAWICGAVGGCLWVDDQARLHSAVHGIVALHVYGVFVAYTVQ